MLTTTNTSSSVSGGDSSSTSHQVNLLNILLIKPRALNYLNISVVGSVGCGKSTLINALSKGHLHREENDHNDNIYTSSSSSSQSKTMAEDLIFACSFDTFNGYSSVTNSVFSCCSASKRTIDEKYQKVQPILVEAPAQSLPALSGTIASSDVIVCVVNCVLPHSLTWIEEKVKPILDQQRSPILSVDAQGLHYGKPTVVLVTVNSTSYKRTVTPEEITELSGKLKNCQIADFH